MRNLNRELRQEDFIAAFAAVFRGWGILLLCAMIGLAAAVALTWNSRTDNQYGASASVYSISYGDFGTADTAMDAMIAYTQIAESEKILARAAASVKSMPLTYDQVRRVIRVSLATNNRSARIEAVLSDPDLACEVANAVADSFVIEMRILTGTDAIRVLERAELAHVELKTNALRDLWKKRAVIALGAMILGAAVLFLAELLSDRMHCAEQALTEEDDRLLGVIPEVKIAATK